MLLIGRARGGLVFYKNYMYTAKVEIFNTFVHRAGMFIVRVRGGMFWFKNKMLNIYWNN